MKGEGLLRDRAQAAPWFRKAADQRHLAVGIRIGGMAERGQGLSQDCGLVVVWYLEVAEQGDSDARAPRASRMNWGAACDREPAKLLADTRSWRARATPGA